MHHVRIIGPLPSLKTVGSSSGMVFGIWCLPGVKVGSCDLTLAVQVSTLTQQRRWIPAFAGMTVGILRLPQQLPPTRQRDGHNICPCKLQKFIARELEQKFQESSRTLLTHQRNNLRAVTLELLFTHPGYLPQIIERRRACAGNFTQRVVMKNHIRWQIV